MPTTLLTTLFLSALLTPHAAASAAKPSPQALKGPAVELEQGQSAYQITKAQVIVDPAKKLSIDRLMEAEQKKTANWNEADNLNFGYSTARYWVKVPVVNNGAADSDWTLELRYPLIQTVHFYQFTNSRQVSSYQAGRLLPFHSRPVDHPTLLFNFSAPKGTRTDLYLMLESVGTIRALMSIYTHDALLSQSTTVSTAMGVYLIVVRINTLPGIISDLIVS